MFSGLFKSKEETTSSINKEEVLRDKLWSDDKIRYFFFSHQLNTNKNNYSVEDLINVKNSIEAKRKRDIEENHKKLYDILRDEYGYDGLNKDNEVTKNEIK